MLGALQACAGRGDGTAVCRLFLTLLATGALIPARLAGEEQAGCPCSPSASRLPLGCWISTNECWYLGHGEFYLTSNNDPELEATVQMDCYNETCRSDVYLQCGNELCVTTTESGETHWTGSLSASATGHLNVFLATGIDIEVTLEYARGATHSTSISRQICGTCATSLPRCAGARLKLQSWRTRKSGKTPLFYEWRSTVRCVVGDDFPMYTRCGQVYATIDGYDHYEVRCRNKDLVMNCDCPEPPPHRWP